MAKRKNTQAEEVTSIIEYNGKSYTLMSIDLSANRNVKEIPYNVKEFTEKFDNGDICRDPLIQRTADQWSSAKKSKFILSILLNRPVGTILTAKGRADSKSYTQKTLIDGLQRSTAISDYINNRFALSKNTAPIRCCYRDDDGNIITENFDLAGKKFKALPDVLKEAILEYRLTVYSYEGFSDEELDDIVFCVNNGSSFKPFQKLRTVLGSAMMEYLQPVCDGVFWEKAESIKTKNDGVLGCVVRTLMLLKDFPFKSLSTSEMITFAEEFAESGSIKEIEQLNSLFNQLDSIIHRQMEDEEYTFLTPCNIPHLIKNLYKYNTTENLSNGNYTAFLNYFLTSEDYKEYNRYCCKLASGGGLYSRATVEKRQDIIDNALDNFISDMTKSA
ncbi:MAG: DUF262 domain-containing protein [Oscillospiraceae bacterium]|nr:DUF262 domain-containing protein [Oscillospiraceae bacterium]